MRLSPAETAQRLGETAPQALDQACALLVDPAAILRAWAGPVVAGHVSRLKRDGDVWVLEDADGREIARAEAVILAAGLATAGLADTPPLTPVRGQLSWAPDVKSDLPATAWGGYAAGTIIGLMFGATHDRSDMGLEVRDADHRRNLETLAKVLPDLADQLETETLAGRASVRATTQDRLPLAGPASDQADGLYLLTGFGSRGFAMAPLLAEHVAALALGAPSPLATSLADLVAPQRFHQRARRRHSGSLA